MEKYKPEQLGERIPDELGEFAQKLSEVTGEQLSTENMYGTYEFEADSFTLTFTIEDGIFEIRSIDVRGNTGLGSQLVTAIHEYADDNDLEVIASNVLDTARGFWEKMGYHEGGTEDEYFRAA